MPGSGKAIKEEEEDMLISALPTTLTQFADPLSSLVLGRE